MQPTGFGRACRFQSVLFLLCVIFLNTFGNFIAVLGQNGAGKSLTLHTLAGLRPAAAGGVRIDGEEIGRIPVPSDRADTARWVFATREGYLSNFTTGTLHTLTSNGHLVVGHNSSYRYEVLSDGIAAFAK